MDWFLTAQNWNKFVNGIYSNLHNSMNTRSPLEIDLSGIRFFDLAEAVSLPLIAACIRQDRKQIINIRTKYHRDFNVNKDIGKRNLAAFKYLTSMNVKDPLDYYSNDVVPTSAELDDLIDPGWRNYKAFAENAVMSLLPVKEVRNEAQVENEIIPRLINENFLRNISDNDQKAIGEIFGLKNIGSTETKEYKRKYALLYGGGLGSTLLRESCQNIVKHGLGKSPHNYGVIGLTAYQKIMHKPHFNRCADWQTEYFDTFDDGTPFMRFVIGDNGPGIQTTLENNYRKQAEKNRGKTAPAITNI